MDALLGSCSLAELRQRTGFKWATHPADVLPAFVAEMDFDLAPAIKTAVIRAISAGDCGYAHKGTLGEAYASFSASRLGWDVNPDYVYPIPDVMTGLAEVIAAITPPGSGIVINPPVYPPFWFRFGFSGRRIIEAPLARDAVGRYDLDPAAIDAALSQPGAAAYLLCSPHNPTGNVWSAGQLAMVADLCQQHGAALVVDEIHAPLVLPGAQYVPFGSIGHEMTERAFVFTSATKGWNIPGLKCGIAIAGSPTGSALLAERWEALLAAQLGVLASVAAFTGGLAWLDAASITTGPLFHSIRKGGKVGGRLSDQSVADIVKAHAERVGLDPALFAGHSLRAGFLTSAAKRGASIFKMMDVSRHRSIDTLRGYVRDAELFKDHAGAGLL